MAENPTKLPIRSGDKTPATPARFDWPSFSDLRREMDRLFEDFGRDWIRSPMRLRAPDMEPLMRLTGRAALHPAVDVVESDGGYRITAELPGMDQKDVDVRIAGGVLTIRGEKTETREKDDKGTHVSERRYGLFERAFVLPESVDHDRIEASFAKGVLTLTLPMSAEAKASEKKIDIKAA